MVTIQAAKVNRGGVMSSVNTMSGLDARPEGSSVGGFVSSVGRGIAGLTGSSLLMVSVLLALAVSVNVPGLFASGVLDPKMPHDLAIAFGTAQWPRLMTESATAVCMVTSVMSL